MAAPNPMLASPARSWPESNDWVLQPKWDGFRLLVSVDVDHHVRAWSRHGARLDDRVGDLLEPFADVPAGSVFDGELIALSAVDGAPVQDFAKVGRTCLRGDLSAAVALRYVAFDILGLGGEDVRGRIWRNRNELLDEALPADPRIRLIQSHAARKSIHDELVNLGFEGSLLKRPNSLYRPGRQVARSQAQGAASSSRHAASAQLRT